MEPWQYKVVRNQTTNKWEVRSYYNSRKETTYLLCECASQAVAMRIMEALDRFC